MRPRVLFLARGHGFGHAARDLRIIRAMRVRRPDVEVTVLASGSAATFLALHGEPFTDMDIDDTEDMSPAAAQRVWQLMDRFEPFDLTVSDEVVWALPYCARKWGRRAILLTDWFYRELGDPAADSFLDHAGEILLLDFEIAHPGPVSTSAVITPMGPVVADFTVDRSTARRRLGIAPDATVTVLTVGGMSTMLDNQRIAEVTVAAHRDDPSRHLYVLADGADGQHVTFTGYTDRPELYYRAADVVVTNANGTVTCDLVWNRIPVVAMTHPDVTYPDSFGTRVSRLSEAGLIHHFTATGSPDDLRPLLAAATPPAPLPDDLEWTTGDRVAAHLLDRLDYMVAKDRHDRT